MLYIMTSGLVTVTRIIQKYYGYCWNVFSATTLQLKLSQRHLEMVKQASFATRMKHSPLAHLVFLG
jgi:hypothetical protein